MTHPTAFLRKRQNSRELTAHVSSACETINQAYLSGEPSSWETRYPQERASLSRTGGIGQYEVAKAAWTDAHLRATPAEYEAAMTRIARECGA